MSNEIPPSFDPRSSRLRSSTSGSSQREDPPRQHGAEMPPTIPPRISHPSRTPQAPAQRAQQPYAQTQPAAPSQAPARPKKRRRSRAPRILAALLLILLVWPIGLLFWANGRIAHTEALSGAPATPGHTYLLVGSDSRADGQVADDTEGQRADTMILLHRPASGTPSMISLPRDTYVEVEGYGPQKLNAAYFFGGAPLLVQTVESLTGITVDHYVEIGMGGVVDVVNAVGEIELCLDYDVEDELSELSWQAGCHPADGETALAFARMRYSDPLSDFGRQERQRQVIGSLVREVATPTTLINPFRQVALIDAGVGAIVTDNDTGVVDLGRLALAFRASTGEGGVTGTPPIANGNYQPGGIGSTVLLAEGAPEFFTKVLDGTITQADVHQFD